jgi:hypothetical protein
MELGEFFHYLGGGLVILLGGGLIVWQALAMERSAASRRWPRAPGKVLRVFLDKSVDHESLHGYKYLVKVICQYKVGDSEYTCDRLHFGMELWNDRRIARRSRVLKKYAQGDRVEIAYNPQKPEESILEPGFTPALLTGLVFGLFVFIMGILFLRS